MISKGEYLKEVSDLEGRIPSRYSVAGRAMAASTTMWHG